MRFLRDGLRFFREGLRFFREGGVEKLLREMEKVRGWELRKIQGNCEMFKVVVKFLGGVEKFLGRVETFFFGGGLKLFHKWLGFFREGFEI